MPWSVDVCLVRLVTSLTLIIYVVHILLTSIGILDVVICTVKFLRGFIVYFSRDDTWVRQLALDAKYL